MGYGNVDHLKKLVQIRCVIISALKGGNVRRGVLRSEGQEVSCTDLRGVYLMYPQFIILLLRKLKKNKTFIFLQMNLYRSP